MPTDKKPKAVLLYSGGLDSTIALYSLVSMGVDVIALNFDFFCTGSNNRVYQSVADNTRRLGVNVITVGVDNEYLEVLKNPRYGYGRSVNPCVDCRIYMLKYAKKVMDLEGADFIATGEVVGQRPFSQKVQRLMVIDKEAGVEGLVVRPLSGKLLPETIPEKKGLVKREAMFDLQGRGRRAQMKLAEQLGIKVYPTPAGGCLLTESAFGRRFRDLKKYCRNFDLKDVLLLRFGRHFRLDDKNKIIICRNESENKAVMDLVSDEDTLFTAVDHKGPVGIYIGDFSADSMKTAASHIISYSKAPRDTPVKVKFWNKKSTFCSVIEAYALPKNLQHKNLI
ncbi:MAG: tRNA 4-thiouridine(8) synthase ThiI [Nitrososphaeria archaeon]